MRRVELDSSAVGFEMLFRHAPIPIYQWERRGDDVVLLEVNVAADAFTGGRVQSFIGRSLNAMFPEGGPVADDVRRCYERRSGFTRELNGFRVRSSGETKDLVVTYVFGPPAFVFAALRDVTGRRRVEAEVRKLSNAVEQTADTVFITGPSGVIEYVNPAFEMTTGYARSEAVGNTPRILKSGLHGAEFYRGLWETILSGETFRATVVNRKKDGTLYHAEQTVTPMKDRAGRITHMVSVLKDMTDRIAVQRQEAERSLAREVQQRLFPAADPELPGFDIAGGIIPAGAACGDYLDYLSIGGGRLGIVVGDVCGHGTGPALVMAETRAYLRCAARDDCDPHRILARLHEDLLSDLDGKSFVTMILACLDAENRRLAYASAGHVTGFVLDHEGNVDAELRSTGRPLGLLPELAMQRAEPVSLPHGGTVVLFSDGVIETESPEEEEFGAHRLLDVVRDRVQSPAAEVVDEVWRALGAFADGREQRDDRTLVICKVDADGDEAAGSESPCVTAC